MLTTQNNDKAANREGLDKAIRSIPLKNDITDSIIFTTVSELIMVSGLTGINALPQAQERGLKQTIKELKKFENLALELRKHIQSMHKTARDALEFRGNDSSVSSYLLEADLKEFILLSKQKQKQFEEQANIPARGGPKAVQAEMLTDYLYREYVRLTGKTPTQKSKDGYLYGEFYTFVNSIFQALKIAHSAQSQVKSCLKRNRVLGQD